MLGQTGPVLAQVDNSVGVVSTQKADDAIRASLTAIASILEAQKAKREIAKELRQAIDDAVTDIDKNDLGKKLTKINSDLAKLNSQVVSLATGVSESDFNTIDNKFELQEELEQLVRPFVWILKSATENARQIENLKRTLLAAKDREKTATEAIIRIQPMIDRAASNSPVSDRLNAIMLDWQRRQVTAKDLVTTVEQQLLARKSEAIDPGSAASRAFTSFFSERGRNLLIGAVAFTFVILGMRLFRRLVFRILGSNRNRSFVVRFSALVYDVMTIALAFGTTIAIFNFHNDWFLTGAMLVIFLTICWLVLKSLPSILEQVTLLLNLGAVQEGERLIFNNIPWKVTKLDLYSELENPSLRGGQFTVPVRELKGQHSRPMDDREKWFPCEEGDWVVLEGGLWAEVVLQSPEAVHLREEGGAVSHFPTTAFLNANPKNVSHPFRATVEFGIDYSHQSDAADHIPQTMKHFIERRARETFGSELVLATYVTLFRAGESSLDYEIEIDVCAGMGHVYETIHHSMIRFAVECCSENCWNIPFPQLTIHRQ